MFAYANIVISIICACAGLFIFRALPEDSARADWSIRRRRAEAEDIPTAAPESLAESFAAPLVDPLAEVLEEAMIGTVETASDCGGL